MNWFRKLFPTPAKSQRSGLAKRGVPEGIWTKCAGCQAVLYAAELQRHLKVCMKCDHHNYLTARERLEDFLDKTPDRVNITWKLPVVDRLKFKDTKKYKDRINAAQRLTDEKSALVVMQGCLLGMPVVACAFEFKFIGGSMGALVGEGFVRAVEKSLVQKSPLVCFCASGGARMQEGLVALMQMAKTSAALSKLSQEKIPFISVLVNPTMGGVSASLAMLGDIIIAEPKALIGFAGPRVIAQTVNQTLPEGFQTSEFLLEHGAIDMIIHRKHMRRQIAHLLAKLTHRAVPV